MIGKKTNNNKKKKVFPCTLCVCVYVNNARSGYVCKIVQTRKSYRLAIIFRHLCHEFVDVRFADLHEHLALPAEIINVAGVYVEPQGVYVQIVRLQTLP